jgi:hypothetical protein
MLAKLVMTVQPHPVACRRHSRSWARGRASQKKRFRAQQEKRLIRAEASAAISGDEAARAVVEAVRELVVRVDIIPETAAPHGVQLNLTGNLAHFLSLPDRAR